jgi:hypothetical protein
MGHMPNEGQSTFSRRCQNWLRERETNSLKKVIVVVERSIIAFGFQVLAVCFQRLIDKAWKGEVNATQ